MRRARLFVPMIGLCLAALLGSCGGAGEDGREILALREEFVNRETWSGTAQLTADYGQRVYEYTVVFSGSRDGVLTLELTAPEEVAGITATVEAGETCLEFEGMRLETGPLNGDGLSPLDALPALFQALEAGPIAETGREKMGERELLRLCCRDPESPPGEGMETILWLDAETHSLVRGELRRDGFCVIQCTFTAFTYTISTEEKG